MIKKIIYSLNALMVLLIIGFYASSLNFQDSPYFYSLKENYFDIFSPNITYSFNYYLRKDINLSEVKEKLNNSNIYLINRENFTDFSFNSNTYQLIILEYTLSKPLEAKNLSLEIEYQKNKYELILGDFSIKNGYNNSLSFNYLNAFYSYTNNNLLVKGIALELPNALKIKELKINDFIVADLNHITRKIPTEIILKEKAKPKSSNSLKAFERVYIPLIYLKENLANRINLLITDEENNKYFIRNATGLVSFKNLKDYPSYLAKGELSYD